MINLNVEASLKEALKPELSALNKQLETLSKSTDGFLGDLLSYVLQGSGKRVRPALVYLASQLGKSDQNSVRTVEMAVELIHIATLIHDDVIDKAALRRGQKTVYDEFGVDTAVLLGDHIYTYAFTKVADLGVPKLVSLMAESTATICQGEIEQLKKRYQFDISEKDYFSFIRQKTASLFGASAEAGAVLSNQTTKIQQALNAYGLHLGVAFQITDDILDIDGSEKVVGKTLRTDLLHGKMTLPLIRYCEIISKKEKKGFLEHLKNPNGHLPELIKSVEESGAIQYAESKVNAEILAAKKSLDAIPSGEIRDLFNTLADTLQHRTS